MVNSRTNQIIKPKYFFSDIPYSDKIKKNHVHFIGFGFDGTASYKKGTKHGPNSIREVSDALESYSPFLNKDLTNENIIDIGNIVVKDEQTESNFLESSNILEEIIQDIYKEKGKWLLAGGEHSISYASIKYALQKYSNLTLIHLDAHADLRDGYLGNYYSHASIIKRSLDHFSKNHKLIQFGIRSGTQKEFTWMKANKTLISSKNEFIGRLENIDSKAPVYLTLDLDFFDPSFISGTGTPEPGGYSYYDFEAILKILNKLNLISCDVVELSPNLDTSGASSIFAWKIIRELLLCLA